jgi:surface polysaccharide O-acyltransferase-like enzyme
MGQAALSKTRIVEFDLLKVIALLLLLFVHSDLYDVFPEVILPIKWILLSVFFFVSGFLTFDSFRNRGTNLKFFFKSKIRSLYIPFAVAVTFYFLIEIATRVAASPRFATGNLWRLLSQLSMLNIFDKVNSGSYNWGLLWFIPYLLLFMLTFCVLEKYVKNVRYQALIVTFFWLCTILAWVYNVPVKLGLEVSQYFLVFTVGFWLNKLRMYDGLLSFKTAYVAAPLAALFSIDFSGLFNTNNASQTFLSLLYFTGRSVILSTCVILLVLIFLRKLSFPYFHYLELIAKASIFIYLLEPIVSYAIRVSVFRQTTIYFAAGADFYIYMAIRIAVLFVALPLVFKVIKNYNVSRRSI